MGHNSLMMMKGKEMPRTYTYDERIVSDLHKDAFGFRPSQTWWTEWDASDEEGKQQLWDWLLEALDAEMEAQRKRDERAINEFEDRVNSLVQLGAPDRLTAIRWIVESLELTETDLCYGADYVCYRLNLPYSCAILFTEAVRDLLKKVA